MMINKSSLDISVTFLTESKSIFLSAWKKMDISPQIYRGGGFFKLSFFFPETILGGRGAQKKK